VNVSGLIAVMIAEATGESTPFSPIKTAIAERGVTALTANLRASAISPSVLNASRDLPRPVVFQQKMRPKFALLGSSAPTSRVLSKKHSNCSGLSALGAGLRGILGETRIGKMCLRHFY
jgi:hypothetical protein